MPAGQAGEGKPSAAADRKARSAAKRTAKPAAAGGAKSRPKPKPGSSRSRTLTGDARKVSGVAVGVGAELVKLVQIAAGAVLIAGGLLLPRSLRPAPAVPRAETTADRRPGCGRRLRARGGEKLERGRARARRERPVEGERGVSGAST